MGTTHLYALTSVMRARRLVWRVVVARGGAPCTALPGVGVVDAPHRVAGLPEPEEAESTGAGHIALIVAGSVVLGLVLALLLDLAVFVGAREHVITGGMLLGFAAGWAALAVLSERWTDQPQRWALVPAVYMAAVGAALLLSTPTNRTLHALGWLWPLTVLALVAWMVRGSRRHLNSRTRPWLLYPVFGVLVLAALGGLFDTVRESTATNARPADSRMVDVGGYRLYLRCTGSGGPTVVLENGLMERTPTWSWITQRVARYTRVCAYDRAGTGWSESASGPQDGWRSPLTCTRS